MDTTSRHTITLGMLLGEADGVERRAGVIAYFGSGEASFWKRGSFRSGSNMGSSRSSGGEPGKLSEKLSLLFRSEGGDDFLEARIAAERVPEGQQFQLAIAKIART